MPDLQLTIIAGDGGRPLTVLMTPDEEQRTRAALENVQALASDYEENDLVAEAVATRAQARQIRKAIDANDRLKRHPQAKVITVTFNEPTVDDLKAVRGNLKDGDLGQAKQTAYERLKPACPDFPDGLPLRLFGPLSEFAYSRIDYNPDEERQLFSMGWPEESA